MSQSCTVLIASANSLPALKEQSSNGDGELLAFTDADALRALEAITSRKPAVVALDKVFASTPRGAALINRIKADPTLKQTEIRIISADSDFSRGTPGRAAGTPGGAALAGAAVAAAPAEAPTQPLDQRGTRRAPRFKITGHVEIVVDGNPAKLLDISTIGAQVVSSAVLKPNQRFRVWLTDDQGDIRVRGTVAWASFEISANGPRYRAGIEFLDANPAALNAYIARRKS